MQMEKYRDAAFLGYFVLLLILVFTGMKMELNLVNLIYLVVVLSCSLRFILIVNKERK